MKKTIFLSIVGFLASMTISAETVETVTENTDEQTAVQTTESANNIQPYSYNNTFHAPCVYNVNGYDSMLSLASPDGSSYDAGYKQNHDWRSARTLRNIGCGVCLVGVGTFTAGIILATVGITKTTLGDVSMDNVKDFTTGVYLIIPGALVTTAGAIMWGVGNHKMKKARLNFTGNGLSYNF